MTQIHHIVVSQLPLLSALVWFAIIFTSPIWKLRRIIAIAALIFSFVLLASVSLLDWAFLNFGSAENSRVLNSFETSFAVLAVLAFLWHIFLLVGCRKPCPRWLRLVFVAPAIVILFAVWAWLDEGFHLRDGVPHWETDDNVFALVGLYGVAYLGFGILYAVRSVSSVRILLKKIRKEITLKASLLFVAITIAFFPLVPGWEPPLTLGQILLLPGLVVLLAALTGLDVDTATRQAFLALRNRPKILAMFVVHESGLLLASKEYTKVLGGDEDIVIGMLNVIRSFVSKSFSLGLDKSLKEIAMGDFNVTVTQGRNSSLVVLLEGTPNDLLRSGCAQALDRFESQNRLLDWSGAPSDLVGVEELIEYFDSLSMSE